MKLINDLPHNTCLCTYHANFMEAVAALNKAVPNFPTYENGFVQQFLCQGSSMDCWFGNCTECAGISVDKLKDEVGDTQLSTNVSWMIWRKNKHSNRVEKEKENGKLSDLIAYIGSISSHFLRHSFVKREQSETFNLHDVPRASNDEYCLEAVLQMDFAENFVCEAQDEVQTAHWNQRQLSLFTTAIYHCGTFQSKVFVSNNLHHTKETIVPYLVKLLSNLPSSVKILKIWSDGPSSQFKNRFIAAMIVHLEAKFEIQIIWNYFATSHGKGCVDGIGAKCIVRNHIKARDCIVNSAADLVEAFKQTSSTIQIEEVTEEDFDEINATLGSVEIYASSKGIPSISSAHQIKVIDGKIMTKETSKIGYN